MPHATRPISVADIQNIYGGRRPTEKPEEPGRYKKASFFDREAGHPGSPPDRPPVTTKRHR
jgi:hypothetical protein